MTDEDDSRYQWSGSVLAAEFMKIWSLFKARKLAIFSRWHQMHIENLVPKEITDFLMRD